MIRAALAYSAMHGQGGMIQLFAAVQQIVHLDILLQQTAESYSLLMHR